MQILLVLASTLLVCACSSTPYFDPYLAPYVGAGSKATSAYFGELKNARQVQLPVRAVAECQVFAFENVVVVDWDAWAGLSEAQRYWVIRHELGHCEEGLDHDERLDRRGCPATYMYPIVPAERCLEGGE